MPAQLFKTTNPTTVTATLGSPIVSVPLPAGGKRDAFDDIEVGMRLYALSSVFVGSAGVVTAFDKGARTVTMAGNPAVGGTSLGTFYTADNFVVPAGVAVMYATLVGGGQGGAGGHTAASGGGGGGGGATATFADMALFVVPGSSLAIHVGIGSPGGIAGAQPLSSYMESSEWHPRSSIDADVLKDGYQASDWHYVPNGRPEMSTAGRPTAGTLSAGGNGGRAAPPIAAAAPSGNAGGAGGTAGVNAGTGLPSSFRGRYGRMGGSGGGGAGPSNSIPGEGGSDTVETNNLIGGLPPAATHFGAGGSGGSSPFGKGGLSGHPDNPSAGIGESGRGYGSGGGGGYTGFAGGDGAPGIIILRW